MQLKSPVTDYEGGLLSGRRGFHVHFNGQGGVLAVDTTARCVIPVGFVATGWTILSDVAGSVVVGVKRANYSGFPSFESVAGTEKPTLSSAQKNQDNNLSSWLTLSAGDIIDFVVESAVTVTKVTVLVEGRVA